MRRSWERKIDESEVVVCDANPTIRLRVYTGGKRPRAEAWAWTIQVERRAICLGDASTRSAAEAAAVLEMRKLLSDIERALPRRKGKA